MKRWFVATLLAAASLAVAPAPAAAQMAGALGKPLPSGELETGAVSIRVVAGSPSSPVTGTEVTLLVNGTPQVARTDNAGRAHFKNLPPGAQVQAKVAGEDGKEATSDTFPVPAQGGVRVMLSTRPWSAAGAPAMPAGAGQPSPRQMSGQPRPEPKDSPGTFTVRVSHDDFSPDGVQPVDVPVALVGYHANDAVDLRVGKTDKEGRAHFEGLDRTGTVSYFAMTLLPRGDQLERLTATPAVMDPRTGVRLILSGDKLDSTAPAIDDLSRFESQDNAPAPGKVRVTLEGGVDPNATVMLVEIAPEAASAPGAVATARRVFGQAKPRPGPPDPTDIRPSARFEPRSTIPPNTLEVNVRGGVDQSDAPLEGVSIAVVPAAEAAERHGQIDAKTGPDGTAKITVAAGEQGPFVALVTINGKAMTSRPFELAKEGGVLDVRAHWDGEGKPQVEFDLVPRPGQVFFAETVMHGQLYRSLPFQPVPGKGTSVSIYVFPRVLFSFSLTSRVDDEYVAVNGRFEISNNAWAPYVGGHDGIILPLPKGFVGGVVAERDQADVAIVPGEGFRLIRPLPPGKKAFHGGFSLLVTGGKATWHLDLPYGSFNSGMEILQTPGMSVETPPGVRGETVTVPQGTFFVLPQIAILPKQSMVMTLSGLPQQPAWKVWLPRITAMLVIVMMLVGLIVALVRRREPGTAEREVRRQKLLDELVELDQTSKTGGKHAKRREQIMAELESLWGDDAEGSRPSA